MPAVRHVVLVLLNLQPYGSQRVALNLATALKQHCKVSIVTLEKAPPFVAQASPDVEHVELSRTARGPLGYLLLARRLARVYKDHRVDGVIAIGTFANIVALTASLGWRNRPKVLVTEHGLTSVSLPSGERNATGLAWLLRRLYPRAVAVVAVSQAGASDLMVNYGLAKVDCIYNPVDSSYVRRLALAEPDAWLGVVPGATDLICVARLNLAKGHRTLLEAMSLLGPAYRLLLIGDGPLEPELRALSAHLGLSSRVHFSGWQSNPYPSMAAADLLVLPSEWEGFGLVVVEAAALGTPSVVSEVGGLAEVAGLVGATTVPPGNPSLLAQAIRNATAVVAESWQEVTNPDRVAQAYLDLFDDRDEHG